MFNKKSIFEYFVLYNVRYNIYFDSMKDVDFFMDPSVWKFLPFDIVEIIFYWLPL